jgi:hypothetical protein
LIEEWDGKNMTLLALILLLLALLVLLKLIHTRVVHRWATLPCPTLNLVGEPLPQLNHHRGFGSYFWDAAANYGQHV